MKVKIRTTEKIRKGAVFHYTPFIFHVLFPEIIKEVYQYSEVIRERSVSQTLGFFRNIYNEVMDVKHREVPAQEFNSIDAPTIECEFTDEYHNLEHFNKFRNFVFNRYNIDPAVYDNNYPEILLIKRHSRVELLDADLKSQLPISSAPIQIDPGSGKPYILKMGDRLYDDAITAPWLVTNGRERREIDRIDDVETYMKNKFGSTFGSVYLELIPFQEQVKYFNNARIIVCAHGGGMVNLFFCKPSTQVLEVSCKGGFPLFDIISNVLDLDHVKCHENQYDKIINFIESNL